jgi:hypothetical protein
LYEYISGLLLHPIIRMSTKICTRDFIILLSYQTARSEKSHITLVGKIRLFILNRIRVASGARTPTTISYNG